MNIPNFNSIKVQLEHSKISISTISFIYFNSIKVQLELLGYIDAEAVHNISIP